MVLGTCRPVSSCWVSGALDVVVLVVVVCSIDCVAFSFCLLIVVVVVVAFVCCCWLFVVVDRCWLSNVCSFLLVVIDCCCSASSCH